MKRARTPLGKAAARLRDALAGYPERTCPGVAFVLNPLDYAWENHLAYLERHGGRPVEAVLLGMNPGPWGMAQTGVPFGSPDLVKEFLGISGPVRAVARTHASRPILGFEGTRTEVSGQRLWGAVRDCFGTPDAFFARFLIVNYCPLVLQSETGSNVTPDKVKGPFLKAAFAACDAHLADALRAVKPTTVIGVGAWATKQAKRVLEGAGLEAKLGTILHPSPASPAANVDWLGKVRAQLEALGHPWPEPVRGVVDAALRDLERRWLASRAPDDELALLQALRHAGRLDERRLRLAARIGSTPAWTLLGEQAPPRDDEAGLFTGLESWGREVVVRVALTFAEAISVQLGSPRPDAKVLENAVAAARAWCECPCPRHAGLARGHPGLCFMTAHERHAQDRTFFAALRTAGAACHAIFLAGDMVTVREAEESARMAATPDTLRSAVARDVLPWALSAVPASERSEGDLLARWRDGDVEAGAGWVQKRRERDGTGQGMVRVHLAAWLGDPAAAMNVGHPLDRLPPDRILSGVSGPISVRIALAAARVAVGDTPELAALLAAGDSFVCCPCDEHRAAIRSLWHELDSSDDRARCVKAATRWSVEPEVSVALLGHHMVLASRETLPLAMQLVGSEALRDALRRDLVPWLLDLP